MFSNCTIEEFYTFVEESKPLIEPATDEEIKVVLKKIKEDLTSERPLSPLKVR